MKVYLVIAKLEDGNNNEPWVSPVFENKKDAETWEWNRKELH